MKYALVFRPSAREDMADGYAWYEAKRAGLGESFLLEVHQCVRFVMNSPGGFQRIHRDFRQAPLERYPYVIVYRTAGTTVVIMRVFHCSQDPKKKFRARRK